MLHGCFVVVPTSFMCTFIHFLAFSGTNLLTRCRSASSCFMLFFCLRKVVHEIFSELHGTKNPISYFSVTKPEPKGKQKGDTWRPNTGPVRPALGPRLACVWSHQVT